MKSIFSVMLSESMAEKLIVLNDKAKIPANKKNEIFYKIWTSKEAYIKAIGKGFSFSPDKICLDQDSNGRMSFKEIIGDQDFKKWKLLSFKPHSHFISSIVVDGDKKHSSAPSLTK